MTDTPTKTDLLREALRKKEHFFDSYHGDLADLELIFSAAQEQLNTRTQPTADIEGMGKVRKALEAAKSELWDEWHSGMSQEQFDNSYPVPEITHAIQILNTRGAQRPTLEGLDEAIAYLDAHRTELPGIYGATIFKAARLYQASQKGASIDPLVALVQENNLGMEPQANRVSGADAEQDDLYHMYNTLMTGLTYDPDWTEEQTAELDTKIRARLADQKEG